MDSAAFLAHRTCQLSVARRSRRVKVKADERTQRHSSLHKTPRVWGKLSRKPLPGTFALIWLHLTEAACVSGSGQQGKEPGVQAAGEESNSRAAPLGSFDPATVPEGCV